MVVDMEPQPLVSHNSNINVTILIGDITVLTVACIQDVYLNMENIYDSC